MSEQNVIEFDGISKSFGSIQALESVSFSVRENEVLALMGDNGAGKSTLIKILSGVLQPTGGQVKVRGDRVDFDSHIEAREAGIETVYQDLAVAPNRTVWENIFLGKEPAKEGVLGQLFGLIDEERMRRESEKVLETLGMEIDPESKVKNLSGGQQQAVAVGRAVQSDPSIVVMDEPTSALSVEAAQRIIELIADLRRNGMTVVLIDHNIDEVFQVADRVAVLATGRVTGVQRAEQLTEEQVIQMMMGVSDPGSTAVEERA
jgi:ABC-type sugar transport system ATPase subunit